MYEIERKYLVKNLPENIDKLKFSIIKQGYLNTSSEPILRIRQKDNDYFLTYKFSSDDQKSKQYNICTEYELPITKEAFEHLSLKVDGKMVIKRRYYIDFNDLTLELDIFGGDLNGLKIVEVEFESEEQAESFVKPKWFGKDVSKDPKYRNSNLSNRW